MTRRKTIRLADTGTAVFGPTRRAVQFVRELGIPPNVWSLFANAPEATATGRDACRLAHHMVLSRMEDVIVEECERSEDAGVTALPLIREPHQVTYRFVGSEDAVAAFWRRCLAQLMVWEDRPSLRAEDSSTYRWTAPVSVAPDDFDPQFSLAELSKELELFRKRVMSGTYREGGELHVGGRTFILNEPIWMETLSRLDPFPTEYSRPATTQRTVNHYLRIQGLLWGRSTPPIRRLVWQYVEKMKHLGPSLFLDAALYVLHASQQQRNDWPRNVVSLPNLPEISTGKHSYVLLDPRALRRWLFPLQNDDRNWRQNVLAVVESLQIATGQPPHALLTDVMDGRSLKSYATPEARQLRENLQVHGVERVDAIFVQIHPSWEQRFMPHFRDADGRLFWGNDATRPHRDYWRRPANWTEDARKAIEEFKERNRRNTYYHLDPVVVAFANLSKWKLPLKQLLHGTLMEEGRATSGRADPRYPPIEAPDPTFVPYNGSKGHGYRLEQWFKKTGYELTSTGLRTFLRHLRILHDRLGIMLVVNDHSEWSDFDTVKEWLLAADHAGQHWERRRCGLFLPKDWLERVEAEVRAAGINWPKPERRHARLEVLNSDGAWLRMQRKARRMTLKQVADEVGVSQAMVSKWERGKSPVAPVRRSQLEDLFSADSTPLHEMVEIGAQLPEMVTMLNPSIRGTRAG